MSRSGKCGKKAGLRGWCMFGEFSSAYLDFAGELFGLFKICGYLSGVVFRRRSEAVNCRAHVIEHSVQCFDSLDHSLGSLKFDFEKRGVLLQTRSNLTQLKKRGSHQSDKLRRVLGINFCLRPVCRRRGTFGQQLCVFVPRQQMVCFFKRVRSVAVHLLQLGRVRLAQEYLNARAQLQVAKLRFVSRRHANQIQYPEGLSLIHSVAQVNTRPTRLPSFFALNSLEGEPAGGMRSAR